LSRIVESGAPRQTDHRVLARRISAAVLWNPSSRR
jgi:hypothetical protein